jgi:hypothetical protein
VPRIRLISIFMFLLLSSSALLAENYWMRRDWHSWSKSECERMLNDSPWAQTWGIGKSNLNHTLAASSGRSRLGVAGEQQEAVVYYVQFMSAPPVREALMREEELSKKYDRMNERDQKALDDGLTQKYFARNYSTVIAVHVIYDSNIEPFERQLAQIWQSYPENSVPELTDLILEDGRRIAPIRFISQKGGKDEFDLEFPRFIDGKPIINPHDKTLGLEFYHPGIQDFPRKRAYIAFSIPKMMVYDELVY